MDGREEGLEVGVLSGLRGELGCAKIAECRRLCARAPLLLPQPRLLNWEGREKERRVGAHGAAVEVVDLSELILDGEPAAAVRPQLSRADRGPRLLPHRTRAQRRS